jgi:hypothetical protein
MTEASRVLQTAQCSAQNCHNSLSMLPSVPSKGKVIPLQTLTGPEGSRRLRLPDFKTIGTRRWPRLSALRTGILYPPKEMFRLLICQRLSQPQGHRAAGRMTMKNFNDTIWYRTRDALACSAVRSRPKHVATPK